MTTEAPVPFFALREALPESFRPTFMAVLADNDALAAKVSFADDAFAALDRGDMERVAYYRALYAGCVHWRMRRTQNAEE